MAVDASTVLIEARGLTKVYGKTGGFTAVDGIDLEVRRGEAFGVLGANGAGKSSTMRMIACVSPVTAGTLRILGRDSVTGGAQIRAKLGVVPQDDTIDSELTVRENLLIYGRYFGLPWKVLRERSTRLLEFTRLTEKSDAAVPRSCCSTSPPPAWTRRPATCSGSASSSSSRTA
jgi:lipooligosaccharide transport system ATP-binding protein